MKEWKKLKDNLPENIYVVAYSKRLDLLKALIVGPVNTIYYSSYFVFDVRFAKDHPFSPPKVCYRSVGQRLHPNLYDDGTVCLSLLGTWSGDQSERWHHSRSNMLQLFVSLQGLVLGTKEPYFLEAGYDKLRGTKQGIINSLMFNEMSLLNSLKHMLYHYHSPPVEFREVITKRFQQDRIEVLTLIKACEALLQNQADKDSAEYKEIRNRFALHENPSKGFLQAIVSIKPQLEQNRN